MKANPFHIAQYSTSAHRLDQLPPDIGSEIAFAGRSNAGKSSALNAITGHAGLARTSKTPGRTQQLNVFTLDADHRLIDLPGYGYAKVPPKLRDHWRMEVDAYLRQRESLRGIVLIIDARHPLKEFDRQMLDFCASTQLPCHALLTKADKLTHSESTRTLAAMEKELLPIGGSATAQLFSSTTKAGVESARARLASLLGLGFGSR
jgi:GTP-binding protein